MRRAALVLLLGLAGCTSTMNDAYQGAKTETVQAVQTFDDNSLSATIQALCAQPYGSVVRNQAKIPNLGIIMPAACGAVTSAPVTLTLQAVPDAAR